MTSSSAHVEIRLKGAKSVLVGMQAKHLIAIYSCYLYLCSLSDINEYLQYILAI